MMNPFGQLGELKKMRDQAMQIQKELQKEEVEISPARQLRTGIFISLIIGFYDGFIGPGAGSFLILAFIAFLGFDFLHSSAHAKLVNLATNLGSVTLFIIKGNIIWTIALPMAAANMLGGFAGAKLAIAKGNKFIRVFFLVIIVGILLRNGGRLQYRLQNPAYYSFFY